MSIHFYAGYWQFGIGVTNFEGEPYCSLCLLTRVRNATLGLLRIISIIIGIVAWCRVVRRCRLCALSLPIFSTVMTAGVLMACFMRPSATLSRRSSRLRPLHVGVRASDSFSLFVWFQGVAIVLRPLFSTFFFLNMD